MLNSLPDQELVPFSVMLDGLQRAAQFVHYTDDDMEACLKSLYEMDPVFITVSWVEKHEVLVEAFNAGHLTNQLFYARETIEALIEPEGSVCLLCHKWDDCAPVGMVGESLTFENMLHLQYSKDSPAHWVAPDIYCRQCRYFVREGRSWHYTQGLNKREAIDAQLTRLLQSDAFKKRLSENAHHTHRHKFKIRRAA